MGTVEYAVRQNGSMPAKAFVDSLIISERSKISHPLARLATSGFIFNTQKFRKIKGIKESIFEIKSGHIRVLCFQKGNSWVLTNGFCKAIRRERNFKGQKISWKSILRL